jgi:hypothetical protein
VAEKKTAEPAPKQKPRRALNIPMLEINGSSNVSRVGYSPKREVLRVQFAHGGVYDYQKVGPAKYKALLKADSTGGFVHDQIIKGGHACKKLDKK